MLKLKRKYGLLVRKTTSQMWPETFFALKNVKVLVVFYRILVVLRLFYRNGKLFTSLLKRNAYTIYWQVN